MRHIILAAGRGTRLFPITLELPKVLLAVAGNTLLGNQIEISIQSEEIDKIEVVSGFMSTTIEEYLANKFHGITSIVTTYNPDFRINNPIYSLRVAMSERSEEDFIITNGDIYYGPSLMRQILASSEAGISMVVSPYRDHTKGAMTVHVSHGRMVAIYPHAPEHDAYESLGIVVVKGSEARNVFYHSMMRLYKRHLGQPHFWHDILNEAKLEMPIQTHLVSDAVWGEVDSESDLASVNQLGRRIYEI